MCAQGDVYRPSSGSVCAFPRSWKNGLVPTTPVAVVAKQHHRRIVRKPTKKDLKFQKLIQDAAPISVDDGGGS